MVNVPEYSSITIRGVDPEDKIWLQDQASQMGISMSEIVRRLIRDHRRRIEHHLQPSKVFAEYFGEKHGVEVPERTQLSYRPITFTEENEI